MHPQSRPPSSDPAARSPTRTSTPTLKHPKALFDGQDKSEALESASRARSKEALVNKLRIKYIKPNMDIVLQGRINHAIAEAASLPIITSSELYRLQKKIGLSPIDVFIFTMNKTLWMIVIRKHRAESRSSICQYL
eukprot:TRINITY_DN2448_c0_g1_i11.p1 TRINITY_DN2448_c0_g1~~TRINITY_DN2448_c0_g1_i11.p1  ORF type:complete len:136 (-),score=31.77 TRINITY_DN2448_c0_g1_i11:16-423(-)